MNLLNSWILASLRASGEESAPENTVEPTMTNKIFITGATSAIAHAFARIHASENASFYLVGRNDEKLKIISEDLLARGAAGVEIVNTDLSRVEDLRDMTHNAYEKLGKIDIALIAQGILPDQKDAIENRDVFLENFAVNALGPMEIANSLAMHMSSQPEGTIAVISSVAGDRGRQSNYAYGSTKAALSCFTDGLRHSMADSPIHVLNIKPGFVDTPMTAAYDKGPLWATPEKVASDIDKAIKKQTPTLYTPWFWRYIMLIIKHIPEFIFKRLSL
jgi:short-subunit dehydrogenase